MHQQCAHRFLGQRIEPEQAHRAVVANQAFERGLLFGGHDVAQGFIFQVTEVGAIRCVYFPAGAFARQHDHVEQFVLGAIQIELQLAVLVGGADGANRGGAPAVFAQAFRPVLTIP